MADGESTHRALFEHSLDGILLTAASWPPTRPTQRPPIGVPWRSRAASDLTRLLQPSARSAEGHAALAADYGAFTEGLDRPDLDEARLLLEAA